MAIPTWVNDREAVGRSSLTTEEIQDVSETLEIVSNPLRLEILATLGRGETPMSYTDLRAAISVRDNGKLNYHLRQLEGLVERGDGQYALSVRGERLLQQVTDEAIRESP
jgi:DNA-binding transcriptional ArsR family regulator